MNKKIMIAGISVEINTLFDFLSGDREYDTDKSPDFSVSTNEQDIVFEKKKSIIESAREGIRCPDYTPQELESTAVYRKIAEKLPEYDAFVFHGSAVAVGDRAYLFTAKSGTGKTTHTRLWLKNIEGSFVVNGDKPVLRIIDDKPFVCGTPWMGKEGYGCNKTVPLSAVCFLSRSEDNRIEKTEFSKVFTRLISQAYRPQNGELVAKTVRLLEKIGQAVPVYELFCNTQDEAATVAFGELKDDKI